jgi:serine protease Do
MDIAGRIAEEVRRCTVQVLAQREGASGSGLLLNGGRILTNAHVAAAASRLSARLWSGEILEGSVTRRDDRRDLALLELKHNNPDMGTLRDTPASPGEVVVAVGNPFGFVGALSFGVVHSVGPIRGLGRRDWVQAGVRLAPGNSGGPLADSRGRIIGINTMIYRGVGLAIPSAAVQRFLSRTIDPLRLGVTIRPIREGLLILEVEKDAPANAAAILPGDIIVGVNDADVKGTDDLADALEDSGDLARIRFLRGGSSRIRETVARRHAQREAA